MKNDEVKVLRAKEVAAMLSVTPDTLGRWRRAGKGPKWLRGCDGGIVLYSSEAVAEYLRNEQQFAT